MQHTTLQCFSPTTSNFSPGLLCPHIKTQSNTFQMSWRDVFVTKWIPLQTCVSCSRHSRRGWPPHSKVPHQQLPNSPLAYICPHLNPVAYISDELDKQVCGKWNALANMRKLFHFQALHQEWVAIPAQVIHNLIQSMPKRCCAITDFWGGHNPCWFMCPSVSKYQLIELFLGQEEC